MRRDPGRGDRWLPLSIPGPADARGQTARSGVWRARAPGRGATPRTRALLRSPARAAPGSRARALEASLVRLLHSLRAEWAVGSSCSAGWEGEERRGRRRSAWGRGRAAPAGKGLGRGAGPPEWADQGDSPGGLRALPGSPSPSNSFLQSHFGHPPAPFPGFPAGSRSRGWLGVFVWFYFNPLCVVPHSDPRPLDAGKK